MKKHLKILLALCLPMLSNNYLRAQSINGTRADGSQQNNVVVAVPFLLITPQTRSGAMGNAGIAMDGDANSPTINTAAMAFLPEREFGVAVSYSPWLKSIASGIALSYLSGYYRINERNTVSASLRYFSIGNVQFKDNNMQDLGIYSPSEFAFDLGYARSFGPGFSLGGNIRFINSNLFGGQSGSGTTVEAGKAVALDVSGLYKKEIYLFSSPATWSMGANFTNIGTKISYSTGGNPYFLPANLKIGTALALGAKDNRITFAFDTYKLLVPTQPEYGPDGEIVKGRDPNRSVPSGIFGSFSDAPGGLSEELKEIGISTGLEFSFKEKIAFRAGYNYQHPDKGNSSYFTLGTGIKFSSLALDFGYVVGNQAKNPLANTLRFGLQAKFR
jgi:hypothetical protein